MKTTTPEKIKKRLEYLRGELKAERISYMELSELRDLSAFIPEHDVELREAAGLPEFPEPKEQHTPGEWLVGVNSNTGTDCLEIYARGGHMTVASGLGNGPEAEANARLIAAAPQLLEALKRLESFASGFEDDPAQTEPSIRIQLSLARTAIAKATGKD